MKYFLVLSILGSVVCTTVAVMQLNYFAVCGWLFVFVMTLVAIFFKDVND